MFESDYFRDAFWNETYDTLNSVFYYEEYAKSLHRISNTVQYSCIFASITSFYLIFQVEDKYSVIFSLIAIAAQIILAFRPTFSYEKKLIALKYLIEDLNTLYCKMRGDFYVNDAQDVDDTIIAASLSKYINEAGQLETKYIGSYEIPIKKRIKKRADDRYEERKNFIESKPKEQD